jgi:hypothetical protein
MRSPTLSAARIIVRTRCVSEPRLARLKYASCA